MVRKKLIINKEEGITLDSVFGLFKRRAKVKNYSKETIKTYNNVMNIFFQFIDSDTDVSTIEEVDIEEFVFWLRETRSVKDTTVNNYLRHVRSVLYFAMDCGYMDHFKISMPKVDKEIKETYSDEELSRLLKKPNMKKCSFVEYRTWTFENYLVGTGNRISTALDVKIKDIDFKSGVIILRKTKNRKQQIIPLSNSLANVLQEYLIYRSGSDDDYLFCNEYGDKGRRRTFQQAVHDYNIERNVNKTSCHLFRHTFAKNWILNGGDVFRLQKILGHSSMDIVKEYVNMFGGDLQMDFERFNPLDNIVSTHKEKISMKRGV